MKKCNQKKAYDHGSCFEPHVCIREYDHKGQHRCKCDHRWTGKRKVKKNG